MIQPAQTFDISAYLLDRSDLFPRPTDTTQLVLNRLPEYEFTHPELKDPSIVDQGNGTYGMYASIGSSVTQTWLVGRFIATHPNGPWTELSPVQFDNLHGPQLCAPAVIYDERKGQRTWTMYVQTACFEENSIIAKAISFDGKTFHGRKKALITRDMVLNEKHHVVGVYDAGISEVDINGEPYLCMLYSGYRKVGCGDLYMTLRKKNDVEDSWSTAKCVLAQEDVPFHNNPEYEHFEWGLEGAKVIQLANNCFMMIGVCFMPKPNALGTRQRVFYAVSDKVDGTYIPVGIPIEPQPNVHSTGETGHPDTIIQGNDMWLIYQERTGDGAPWHLRSAKYMISELTHVMRGRLEQLSSSMK